MSEDYLWDRSGKPDPEIVRLEELLGPLRWQGTDRMAPANNPRRRMWAWGAAAAVVALVGITFGVRRTHTVEPVTSWRLFLAATIVILPVSMSTRR